MHPVPLSPFRAQTATIQIVRVLILVAHALHAMQMEMPSRAGGVGEGRAEGACLPAIAAAFNRWDSEKERQRKGDREREGREGERGQRTWRELGGE